MVLMVNHPTCPICGGTDFRQYRGRPAERCTTCKAKKRTRAHYLMLSRLAVTRVQKPFYHLSPERAISEKLIALYGDQYRLVDIDPDKFVSPVPVV